MKIVANIIPVYSKTAVLKTKVFYVAVAGVSLLRAGLRSHCCRYHWVGHWSEIMRSVGFRNVPSH
jgi:hypothetical protein